MRSERGLTPKQEAFVREYLVDLNGTQAAIRAGYSAKTAAVIAEENLRKPNIRSAINQETEARQMRTQITADRVLEEIAHVAFLDPLLLFADDGTLLPLKDMPPHARRAIAGIDVEEIWEGRGDDRKMVGYLKKIRLVSKEGTLTLAGRHLKMFTDKTELTGKDGAPVGGVLLVPAPMTSEQWEAEVAQQQALLQKRSSGG